MSTPRTVAVASDVVSETLDGEAVLLDLRNGVYFSLNRVGTRVWQLIQEVGEMDLVRERLLEEFEVTPAEVDRDLQRLLTELVQRGLVVPNVKNDR